MWKQSRKEAPVNTLTNTCTNAQMLDVPKHIMTIKAVCLSEGDDPWWQPEAHMQWWLVNSPGCSFPVTPEIIISYVLQPCWAAYMGNDKLTG